jgi:hypothetical protein
MVVFGTGYNHSLDRDYHSHADNSLDHGSQEESSIPIEQPINAAYHPQQKSDITIADIGQSVTEGNRFGSFRQSVNAAIRVGARRVELQTAMGGGAEPVGAESYGKAAREELREIQRANEVEFHAVHAPTQIGNMSGFVPRQGGPGDFSDEHRKVAIEEIKKAVDFAADVTQGGAVVVHTGEYHRPMSEQEWAVEKNPDGSEKRDAQGNKVYKFLAYKEEPARAVKYLVDQRTGKVIGDVRKNQTVREPDFVTAGEVDESTGVDFKQYLGKYDDEKARQTGDGIIRKSDLLDKDGNWLDPYNAEDLFKRVPKYDAKNTRFITRELTWSEFEKRANAFNKRFERDIREGKIQKRLPEEEFFSTQLQTQMLQYRGSSLFHGRYYTEQRDAYKEMRDALKKYEELESKMPEDEVWKIMQRDATSRRWSIPEFTETKLATPSVIIKKQIEDIEMEMKYTREGSAAADAQADALADTLRNMLPISKYAEEQSLNSYAEVAIHAMQQSRRQDNKRPIFVAPENIFPEMGYGSHPDELIGLVKGARGKMVQYMTEQKIPDPHGHRWTLEEAERIYGKDNKEAERLTGELKMVDNPFFQPGMTIEQARKEAREHVRATFDTQHLAMWRAHFQPKYVQGEGRVETKQETDSRFRNWYMDQVKKMDKEDIIGHIHLVDSMGSGHQHLPAGQGEWPVVDAAEYLKKQGYDITITSEGHGEEQIGQGRILTEVWRTLGSPVYGANGPSGAGGGGGAPRWDSIQHSYFGQAKPPYYIFGNYAPSNDWTLFTQVPME